MTFIIRTLDFEYFDNLDWAMNLDLLDKKPVAQAQQGIAAVSLIHSEGIYRWEGFELAQEGSLKVALFAKAIKNPLMGMTSFDHNYGEFTSTWINQVRWISCDQARIEIQNWNYDTLQILVLVPEYQFLPPVKVGYWIAENPYDYILNYALPHKIKSLPFQLIRWVKCGQDGKSLPMPPNLNSSLFVSIHTSGFQQNSVTWDTERLTLPTAQTPGTILKLLISTQIKVDVIPRGVSYQLTEFPSIGLRVTNQTKKDYQLSVFEHSIACVQGRRFKRIEAWRGQEIEVCVFAESFGDRQIIVNELMGFFSGVDLPLPLFGESIPVQLVSQSREIPNIGDFVAVKPAEQFEICLWGIESGSLSWMERD